jgi:hypothetical protein
MQKPDDEHKPVLHDVFTCSKMQSLHPHSSPDSQAALLLQSPVLFPPWLAQLVLLQLLSAHAISPISQAAAKAVAAKASTKKLPMIGKVTCFIFF